MIMYKEKFKSFKTNQIIRKKQLKKLFFFLIKKDTHKIWVCYFINHNKLSIIQSEIYEIF